jgi:hypothetical protein
MSMSGSCVIAPPCQVGIVRSHIANPALRSWPLPNVGSAP